MLRGVNAKPKAPPCTKTGHTLVDVLHLIEIEVDRVALF